MSQDQGLYRGFVVGILSGDSLIVRFVTPNVTHIQNVCLEHVIAPKFGKADGQIKDEPHGFDSWNFLRINCIGERVLVYPANKTDLSRTHPAFGRMPVFFSRVLLCSHDDEDVGRMCIEAGWVKVRARAEQHAKNSYVSSLLAAEAVAKGQGLGIWKKNGFVRPLPVEYDPSELLDIGEFDAIVESVINGTTLALFLMPRHEHIVFQIAACRSPSARRELGAETGIEAKEFTIRSLLHRSMRIRLCSVSESGLFLGPIIDRSDRHIRGLITNGLARFNPNTADLSPSAIEYERCEAEAKAGRKKIWHDEEPYVSPVKVFEGRVRRILGTSAADVDVRQESRITQFNCIRVPPFIPGGGSEPFGFEARERLRKLLIGKYVTVVVDGATPDRYFGTVFIGDICINSMLVAEGYAKVIPPFCGSESENIDAFRQAQEEATKRKIGVHSGKEPPPMIVKDYSLNMVKEVALEKLEEFKNVKMIGIVEDILGGNRFAVLVPDRKIMVRVAVNGLLPLSPNDELGREAITFCAENYLNRDIEFSILEVDRSGGFISNMRIIESDGESKDIASGLLAQGLGELHHRTATSVPNYDELVEIQEKAKRNGVGKWADKSRFDRRLEYGEFYAVRIVAVWSAVELSLQFLSESMHEIDEIIQTATPPVSGELNKNDIVCVLHNNCRCRGMIFARQSLMRQKRMNR